MDIPADVESVLSQLFGEAAQAFEAGQVETGVAAVSSAGTVATNKLPESTLRAQLLHGCERTETLAVEDETEVAAEYATLMAELVRESATG